VNSTVPLLANAASIVPNSVIFRIPVTVSEQPEVAHVADNSTASVSV
jgi:hypothetical protein